MKTYQITFKNGETMEFATKSVADGYAEQFGLAEPVEVEL
jgi:hypothetical protein